MRATVGDGGSGSRAEVGLVGAPLRAAYVCADVAAPARSRGASEQARELMAAWLRRGGHLELFGPHVADGLPELSGRVPVHVVESVRGDAHAREEAAIRANGALGAALHRRGPFDVVYERYSLFAYAGMEVARALGSEGILEVSAPLVEEQIRDRVLLDVGSAWDATRRCFRAASRVLAGCEEVASYLDTFPEARGKVEIVGGVKAAAAGSAG